MDRQQLMTLTALTYVLTDIRVHLFSLINLLVEKNVISADEFYAMQKKCEVSEGVPVLKKIRQLLNVINSGGDEE